MSIRRVVGIGLLALSVAGGAWAQEAAKSADVSAETEAKLKAARERLEQAAREVAELSAQMGDRAMNRVMRFDFDERRAIIGVQIDPESDKTGARIASVSPGGPAAEAGILAGDVIVAVEGKSIAGRDDSGRELVRQMREVKADQKVKVRVLRDGKTKDFTVIARPRPASAFAFRVPEGVAMPAIPLPPEALDGGADSVFDFVGRWHGELAGLELASMTPKLGGYFGAKQGVLVVRAPENSPYKLEDGDVIEAIDGRVPTSGSHALRILRSYQPGEKVQMKVLRQRKSVTLDATVPERSERQHERRRVRIVTPEGMQS
jgi:C-terminal processing protease CtpA/Prc